MGTSKFSDFVIPAQAEIQRLYSTCLGCLFLLRKVFIFDWIPACTGMTYK
jgi:hypothetical protein